MVLTEQPLIVLAKLADCSPVFRHLAFRIVQYFHRSFTAKIVPIY